MIILRISANDKLSVDMNLKLNMFAWLGLFMAHDPEFLQKDPPGKHLYVVWQIEQSVETEERKKKV